MTQPENLKRIAFDLDGTLVKALSGGEIVIRKGTLELLERLLELDYELVLYTRARDQRIIQFLDANEDIQDCFTSIFSEDPEFAYLDHKDPSLVNANVLVDDDARAIEYAQSHGIIGILVPSFYDGNVKNTDEWTETILSQLS